MTPDPSSSLPLDSVAVIVDDGVSPFEMATASEVFGSDRSSSGLPCFDFAVCGVRPGPLRTSGGFDVVPRFDMSPVETADLVIVPPFDVDYVPEPHIVGALQRAEQRGAFVASLCTGAFVLARAGLLDGRRATTHWAHAAEFRAAFPHVELVPDVLYVEDDGVATSAGTAAGIDLCLHLIRRAHGWAAANGIARRLVVPPHRDGGQAQFVESPVAPAPAQTLAGLLDWAVARLDEDLSVEAMAGHASMSVRTFARRFREETGTTPHQWLLNQRVALAAGLLETTDLPIEEVARRSGFGSATMLRHHFAQLRLTSPTSYRRSFGAGPAA